MRNVRPLVVLALCIIGTSTQAKTKPDMLVLPFKETANRVPDLGGVAQTALTSFLSGLGTVKVVDTAAFRLILNAKGIAIDSLTESTVPRLYAKLTAAYLVVGEVTNGSVSRTFTSKRVERTDSKGKVIGYDNANCYVWRSTPTLSLRVVDLGSGEAVYSRAETSLRTEEEAQSEGGGIASTVSKIVSAAKGTSSEIDPNATNPGMVVDGVQGCVNMHKKALSAIFRKNGVIVALNKADEKGKKVEVIIDIGSDWAVKKGDEFDAISLGEPIKHPTTGELLPGSETKVDDFEIDKVDAQTSSSIVKSRVAEKLRVGMLVRASE